MDTKATAEHTAPDQAPLTPDAAIHPEAAQPEEKAEEPIPAEMPHYVRG